MVGRGTCGSIGRRAALVLGWQVDGDGALLIPRTSLAALGQVADDRLVTVEPVETARHTAVFAQSGSGKSFFVGRLLEEILLTTRANVSVIDPNADFCRFYDAVSDAFWQKDFYDWDKGIGKLPTEDSTREFAQFMRSGKTSFLVMTNREKPGRVPQNVQFSGIALEWGALSHSFFYDERFAPQEVARIAAAHQFAQSVMLTVLWKEYGEDLKAGQLYNAKTSIAVVGPLVGLGRDQLRKELLKLGGKASHTAPEIEQALRLSEFVTPDSWHQYEEYLSRYLVDEVVDESFTWTADYREPARFQALDISSVDRDYQRIVVAETLTSILERARERWYVALKSAPARDNRVPCFVVLEEAHRVAPRDVQGLAEKRCRDLVRDIAAEGRKYGVFLVLVTQRPEKLDRMVVSEVENLAVMRLNSHAAVDEIAQAFALEPEAKTALGRVPSFRKGRVLLLGPWAGKNPKTLFCAMRRTKEGGRSLRASAWARPPVQLSPLRGRLRPRETCARS